VHKPLALSHADACNPLLQAHPTWVRDKHEGCGFPLLRLSPSGFYPLRAPSRADPSGLGHAATIYSSVQGPPGSKRRHVRATLAGHMGRAPSRPQDETVRLSRCHIWSSTHASCLLVEVTNQKHLYYQRLLRNNVFHKLSCS
jgi:hypothetical protein